jgi:hypothetical protein
LVNKEFAAKASEARSKLEIIKDCGKPPRWLSLAAGAHKARRHHFYIFGIATVALI